MATDKSININLKKSYHYQKGAKTLHETAINQIANDDFENLIDTLNRLKKLDEDDCLHDLKNKLNSKLLKDSNACVRKVKILEELDEKSIEIISKDFTKIISAKHYLSNFTYPKEEKFLSVEKITKNETEIKAAIKSCVDHYMKNINKSFQNFNAEDKIKKLSAMRKHLIDFVDVEDDTMNKIKELIDNQSNMTIESLKSFERVEIEDYTFNSPKEVYEKLTKLKDPNIEQAKIQFKKIILSKYDQKLEMAKKLTPPDTENEHMIKCNRSINFLPEEFKDGINHSIKDTERVIKDMIFKYNVEIEKNIGKFNLFPKFFKNIQDCFSFRQQRFSKPLRPIRQL
jgi:hypothetical protein